MRQYIHMTRRYLVIIAIFIALRFSLEFLGPEQAPNFYGGMDMHYLTDEISVTRLLFILPVFLGMRLSRQKSVGWKVIILSNFVYVFWAIGLADLLHLVDGMLDLGTHYGRGFNWIHFRGHIYDLKMWIPRTPSSGFSFCASILLMSIITSLVCFVTIKLNGTGHSEEVEAAVEESAA